MTHKAKQVDGDGSGSSGEAGRGCDVVLVQMPFARIEHPSIALGLLKAALARDDLHARVVYASLLFADEIGLDAYQLVNGGSRVDMNGEWCFTEAAFPDWTPDHGAYLRRGAESFFETWGGRAERGRGVAALVDEFHHIRATAVSFVDRMARTILADRPAIVGCTSTFEQHVASLALLRRIRELAPDVVTLIGGANCEGEMGVATVREFPWVDIAFSGEADEVIAPLCRRLLIHGRTIEAAALPAGAINRELALAFDQARGTQLAESERPTPPRASVRDLEAVPDPDYDEYFETLASLSIRNAILPGLHTETSRGCWWGAIRHCTFCGLNGGNMAYRKKSAARVTNELARLAQRYGIRKFEMVDNILDLDAFDEMIPALAQEDPPYRIFFETKANLKRDQVALLARAGVQWMTAGIESMHDGVLALMEKGTNCFVNLQLLKYAREFGIVVSWNMLTGLPGERDPWHAETADWLDRAYHLSAPNLVRRVRFDRFSPYFMHPERYGIQLQAFDAYRDLYPVSERSVSDLAYYFREADDHRLDANNFRDGDAERPGIDALQAAVDAWQQAQRRGLAALLCMDDDGETISILDTRPCALQRRRRLSGLEAAVYRRCDPTISIERLAADLEPIATASDVRATVEALSDEKLVLYRDDRILALAVPGEIPARAHSRDYAGGHARTPRVARILARRATRLGDPLRIEHDIGDSETWAVAFDDRERRRYRNLNKA